MGVAVFPLTITGFNGTRNVKRNPSHMEVSKEGKKEGKRKRARKEGRKEVICCFLLFVFNFEKLEVLWRRTLGLCASGWNIFAVK